MEELYLPWPGDCLPRVGRSYFSPRHTWGKQVTASRPLLLARPVSCHASAHLVQMESSWPAREDGLRAKVGGQRKTVSMLLYGTVARTRPTVHHPPLGPAGY